MCSFLQYIFWHGHYYVFFLLAYSIFLWLIQMWLSRYLCVWHKCCLCPFIQILSQFHLEFRYLDFIWILSRIFRHSICTDFFLFYPDFIKNFRKLQKTFGPIEKTFKCVQHPTSMSSILLLSCLSCIGRYCIEIKVYMPTSFYVLLFFTSFGFTYLY